MTFDGVRSRNHFDSFGWGFVTVFQVGCRCVTLVFACLRAFVVYVAPAPIRWMLRCCGLKRSQLTPLEPDLVPDCLISFDPLQMMTPAKWSDVLVDAVRGVGWSGAIYIVTLFLVGTHVF